MSITFSKAQSKKTDLFYPDNAPEHKDTEITIRLDKEMQLISKL